MEDQQESSRYLPVLIWNGTIVGFQDLHEEILQESEVDAKVLDDLFNRTLVLES